MDEKDKEIETLKEKVTELTGKLTGASSELAEDRKKRADIEGARDAALLKIKELEGKATPIVPAVEPKVEDVVRTVLQERDKTDAESNKTTAEATFKTRYKVKFDDSSDPGGIKFSAVKAKFSKFNLDGAKTVDDFLNIFEEAYTLVDPKKPAAPTYTPYAATPPTSGEGPREENGIKLSDKEQEVIDRLGWTPEQFKKMKEQRPQYVASLFKNIN